NTHVVSFEHHSVSCNEIFQSGTYMIALNVVDSLSKPVKNMLDREWTDMKSPLRNYDTKNPPQWRLQIGLLSVEHVLNGFAKFVNHAESNVVSVGLKDFITGHRVVFEADYICGPLDGRMDSYCIHCAKAFRTLTTFGKPVENMLDREWTDLKSPLWWILGVVVSSPLMSKAGARYVIVNT
ncbi:DNA ligase, partial [Striga asiatica]